MIISRTPFRISLFGGGSDYPQWYRKHGGSVFGFAIDKYCYISLRELPPFFEHRHRVVYSKVETVNEISEIQHPAVRHVLQEMRIERGMEIHHDGDLPARSGLGSSSSFTVGLLNALNALHGRITTKTYLAQEAIRIEQTVIGENVGSQDQVWAAFGGFGRVDFRPDESFSFNPLVMTTDRRDALMSNLMLFFTGFSRIASLIAGKKIASLDAKAEQIRQMVAMVDQAIDILSQQHNFDDLGRLLHQSWLLKRDLADSVTNNELNAIYDAGMAAGALGGKLLGAGGGGFMLFYVPPAKQESVRKALSRLIEVKFGVDTAGSRIVVYEPDGLHNR